jgi:hypothetical protein
MPAVTPLLDRPEMTDAAHRLLDKLKDFADSLDDEERALLAALLAPGVARAYGEAEAEGFGASAGVGWSPETLPESLAEAVRDRELRIVGW